MPLHPQAKALLDAMNAGASVDLSQLDAPTLRALMDNMGPATERVPVHRVEDLRVEGPDGPLRARLYVPKSDAPPPVLVYFHGGGFVIGSIETHDALCRALANAAKCAVISIEYRLAPEHPFPAAPEDCYAATCWLAEHATGLGLDGTRLAVGGDSAGGNLAAVVARLVRERGGPTLFHQLLIYPVTDCRFDTNSYAENAEGYLLSRDMMKWFWGHYLRDDAQAAEAMASPLRAGGLSGLAAATVLTAEFDPLRDEGTEYARRLENSGVPVEHTLYEGMFHGFLSMGSLLDAAGTALDQSAAALRRSFGT